MCICSINNCPVLGVFICLSDFHDVADLVLPFDMKTDVLYYFKSLDDNEGPVGDLDLRYARVSSHGNDH